MRRGSSVAFFSGDRLVEYTCVLYWRQSSEEESEESGSSGEAVNISSSSISASGSDQSHHHRHHHDGAAELYVAKFDFAHVDTPLLVVLWVLFTAAAKIGQQPTPNPLSPASRSTQLRILPGSLNRLPTLVMSALPGGRQHRVISYVM